MPYDIYVLDESDLTLSNGGLDGVTQGDGSHMVGETIIINSGAWYPVTIDDDDPDFQDNDGSQTLSGDQWINDVLYVGGTVVEAEFSMTLTYGADTYTVVAFNVNNSSPSYGTVEGLAFIGGPGGFPPVGVPLTVDGAAEGPIFEATTYATPICFASGTLIQTPQGQVPVEQIDVGDIVETLTGPKPVQWRAGRTWPAFGAMAPVLFCTGVIGNSRPLWLSQQHRVLVRGWRAELYFGVDEILVAAKHLVNGTDVLLNEGGSVTYHHLMFDSHQIILAEGAETESFFLGDEGLNSVDADARNELCTILPEIGCTVASFGVTAAAVVKAKEAPVLLAA